MSQVNDDSFLLLAGLGYLIRHKGDSAVQVLIKAGEIDEGELVERANELLGEWDDSPDDNDLVNAFVHSVAGENIDVEEYSKIIGRFKDISLPSSNDCPDYSDDEGPQYFEIETAYLQAELVLSFAGKLREHSERSGNESEKPEAISISTFVELFKDRHPLAMRAAQKVLKEAEYYALATREGVEWLIQNYATH